MVIDTPSILLRTRRAPIEREAGEFSRGASAEEYRVLSSEQNSQPAGAGAQNLYNSVDHDTFRGRLSRP
ncbi:hypothetical protein [Nocardia sp. NPDC058497]|uniref:hypothetical protein n=1 Tax=Nocardia sp. NPDC058497 TaxID=3346529 RepID=UPI003667F2AC